MMDIWIMIIFAGGVMLGVLLCATAVIFYQEKVQKEEDLERRFKRIEQAIFKKK